MKAPITPQQLLRARVLGLLRSLRVERDVGAAIVRRKDLTSAERVAAVRALQVLDETIAAYELLRDGRTAPDPDALLQEAVHHG